MSSTPSLSKSAITRFDPRSWPMPLSTEWKVSICDGSGMGRNVFWSGAFSQISILAVSRLWVQTRTAKSGKSSPLKSPTAMSVLNRSYDPSGGTSVDVTVNLPLPSPWATR